MENSTLRDVLLTNLESRKEFEKTITKLDGNYFAAADIVFSGEDGEREVFRIAVIKYNKR